MATVNEISSAQPMILFERLQDVLFVTLNRPQTRHALAPEMIAELSRILDIAEADSTARALVLRGSHGFFCAGGNVGNFQARLDASATSAQVSLAADPVAARNREFGRLMERLSLLSIPILAAVEGAAIGGGMGLACVADMVLATVDAKFALSETSLGIIPAQIAPFVVARLGTPVALRLGLSGEQVSGEVALRLGLVDELCSDSLALDALLAQWLSRVSACGPQANRALKPLLQRCGHAAVGLLLDDAARLFADCMRSEGAEGIAAFREKRSPAWRQSFTAHDVRTAQHHGHLDRG